jgi:hypothetical protein
MGRDDAVLVVEGRNEKSGWPRYSSKTALSQVSGHLLIDDHQVRGVDQRYGSTCRSKRMQLTPPMAKNPCIEEKAEKEDEDLLGFNSFAFL